MSMIKYRVHEVAKDFNVASKVISQILTDYIAPPKNHMQVLENHELDVIFEYMTQHNQVASLEEIFKVESPVSAPKAEEKPAPAQPAAKAQEKSAQKAPDKGAAPSAPSTPAVPPRQPAKQNKPHVPAAAQRSISRNTTKSLKIWPAPRSATTTA